MIEVLVDGNKNIVISILLTESATPIRPLQCVPVTLFPINIECIHLILEMVSRQPFLLAIATQPQTAIPGIDSKQRINRSSFGPVLIDNC